MPVEPVPELGSGQALGLPEMTVLFELVQARFLARLAFRWLK